jgi:hypothetical protein
MGKNNPSISEFWAALSSGFRDTSMDIETNKLSNRRKRQIQMASVGPTPCSGLKSDIASPIPKAHFETVLNMSPDAFATEARAVTQVVRLGLKVPSR